jgi:apolipoprotein D and lipocalin family protein
VASYNKSYLWFLSRIPTVSVDLRRQFLEMASSLGYDTDSLIFVNHDKGKAPAATNP